MSRKFTDNTYIAGSYNMREWTIKNPANFVAEFLFFSQILVRRGLGVDRGGDRLHREPDRFGGAFPAQAEGCVPQATVRPRWIRYRLHSLRGS